MLLLLSLARAAPMCPRPDAADQVVDLSIADDGDAYVLTSDGVQTCWWIIDDREEGHVAGRWQVADGAPVAIEVLADGRALFALADGRLHMRSPDGTRHNLRVEPGGRITRMIAHPVLPLVALVVGEGKVIARVVDVDHEIVVQDVILPSAGAGIAFSADSAFVRVDRPKVSDAAQSRR